MFLFARVFGLFYYYYAVFRKCICNEIKCCVIVGACPEKSKKCQYLITA